MQFVDLQVYTALQNAPNPSSTVTCAYLHTTQLSANAGGTFAVQLVACGSAPPVHECTAEDSVIQTYTLTASSALEEACFLSLTQICPYVTRHSS